MGENSYSGRGYWASQMIVCAVAGVGGIVGGPIVMLTDDESPGYGLIFFLAGIAFLCTFVWLVRAYRRSDKQGRAIYAWAIMQQHEYRIPRNDVVVMATAARARGGGLTLDELRALQAMRPEIPYPGEWPTDRTRRNPGP
ncbi:hypothetical protein CLV49_1413 [Labedella gwakjiensis]|uniref:Uncharacterized protein n=1 Tax=Labedella gwakjiensis TaxID=390269 RepID=A0A2P8GV23_9MICO|nr:hypothetical protein [Labedella gwakjiensis]PSL37806.1 hypothetical protein CLV49_1413 [Labedella gwakjiensis]RUQ87616.1 hypothetical protein ELQ93_12135 [Labedella gwakjiensis]